MAMMSEPVCCMYIVDIEKLHYEKKMLFYSVMV